MTEQDIESTPLKKDIPLTTQYRPKSFADTKGQDIPKTILQKIAKDPTGFTRSLILAGSFGCGKALVLSSKIITPNGYILMEDISVGDDILGSDGFIYQVTGVYPQGKKQVYRLILDDDSYVDCCIEHLWSVNVNKSNKLTKEVLTTQDILNGIKEGYKYSIERFFMKIEYDYPLRYIKAIKDMGYQEDMQCISVNSPDKLFMVNDYILTHNTTTARVFAKAINCKSKTGDACNKCQSCIDISQGSNLYMEFDSSIVGNVERMKEIRDTLSYSVTNGYKVVVLDETHLISKQAMSTLLKVIEEASPNIFYLFCLSGDSMLLTDSGFKFMKNITTNDLVYTEKGMSKIKNVFKNGVQKVYKLKTNNGYAIKTTDNHKIQIFDGDNFIWKELKDIKIGDFLPLHHSYNKNRGLGFTKDECTFLGWLVGDGTYSKRHLSIVFNLKEWDSCKKLMDKNDISYTPYLRGSVYQCTINNRHIIKEKYGLLDYEDGRKLMPTCVYRMSPQELLWFYEGWRDADGHITKTPLGSITRRLTCSNTEMLEQLQNLLLSVGVFTSYGEDVSVITEEKLSEKVGMKVGTYYTNRMWELKKQPPVPVSNTLKQHLIDTVPSCFKLKYPLGKKSSYFVTQSMIDESDLNYLKKNIIYSKVKSIDLVGEEEVFDIEVPETSSFIANGFNVHNCTTDPDKMMDTIKSRSLTLTYQELTNEEMKEHITDIANQEGQTLPSDVEEYIIRRVKGHVRDSLQQLQLFFKIGYDDYKKQCILLDKDFFNIIKYAQTNKITEARDTIKSVLKHPVPYIRQDFEEVIRKIANSIYISHQENKNILTDRKLYQRVVQYYLENNKNIVDTTHWFIFLSSMISVIREPEFFNFKA